MVAERDKNRLTIVPALEYYALTGEVGTYVIGDLEVRVREVGGRIRPLGAEPFIGMWSANDCRLKAVIGSDDCGPRSGKLLEYTSATIASGKLEVGLSRTRLLGSFTQGHSCFGHTQADRNRVLVFSWHLSDIDKIEICRTKKYFKLWIEEMFIICDDPHARLRLTSVGRTRDESGKLQIGLKSDEVGFARLLADLAGRCRNTSVQWETVKDHDGEDEVARIPRSSPSETLRTEVAAAAAAAAPASPSLGSPVMAPPAWYPNPTGKGVRYWDGETWTGHVHEPA